MRTTITLDDRLLAQLKRRAAERQSFELVIFGAGGRFSPKNIDKTAALLEADDLERFASRR